MKIITFGILLVFSVLIFSCATNQENYLAEVMCQSIINPVGFDVSHPSFSWIVESAEKEEKQTAYHIQPASLTGKAFNCSCILHKEISAGGKFISKMGNEPNISWGINSK